MEQINGRTHEEIKAGLRACNVLPPTCKRCPYNGDVADRILHQSDVIELLVGALRDALDHPKNRPITKQEILESIQVIPCVIEEKKFGMTYADILRCSQWDKRYYGMYNAITSAVGIKKYEIDDYGKTWRCWAIRPTDEEREAAAWET